jgi:hypothetical protein
MRHLKEQRHLKNNGAEYDQMRPLDERAYFVLLNRIFRKIKYGK